MAENIHIDTHASKAEQYASLLPQLKALVEGEEDAIANISNIIAGLKETFSFFWIGIYFVKKSNLTEELVLGPFQGPIACTRIQKGKGVCGTAWDKAQSILVPDVDLFPGHIACSSLSRSEIVLPVIKNEKVVAVLDVDSEFVSHFDETDQKYLEEVCKMISAFI
ncbi:MAG: GAF domain-containing protein [Bacteroidia bacterium]|nr:GAF domain-containing protein [Bacteroidia bacterium]MBP9922597.1 GAF domain-containing protein [Bacteroidia bacterium]